MTNGVLGPTSLNYISSTINGVVCDRTYLNDIAFGVKSRIQYTKTGRNGELGLSIIVENFDLLNWSIAGKNRKSLFFENGASVFTPYNVGDYWKLASRHRSFAGGRTVSAALLNSNSTAMDHISTGLTHRNIGVLDLLMRG